MQFAFLLLIESVVRIIQATSGRTTQRSSSDSSRACDCKAPLSLRCSSGLHIIRSNIPKWLHLAYSLHLRQKGHDLQWNLSVPFVNRYSVVL